MKGRCFDYIIYNWLRKKGVRISVLTANFYPMNFAISVDNNRYLVVFRELSIRHRITVHNMRYGENIFVLIYDKRKSAYYFVPSFCFMTRHNKRAELVVTEAMQKKYVFSPLETFCEQKLKKVSSISKDHADCARVSDPHQPLLQEFFH